MQNPDNIDALAEADTLAILTYQLVRRLPSSERFELGSQLRRAAVSVGSNIVEGCGYETSRALVSYLYRSNASAGEVAYQFRLAAKLGFFTEADVAEVREQAFRVQRMLSRLIVYLRDPRNDKNLEERKKDRKNSNRPSDR